jgi:hypothetical protein
MLVRGVSKEIKKSNIRIPMAARCPEDKGENEKVWERWKKGDWPSHTGRNTAQWRLHAVPANKRGEARGKGNGKKYPLKIRMRKGRTSLIVRDEDNDEGYEEVLKIDDDEEKEVDAEEEG